jgi:hypothetical protein
MSFQNALLASASVPRSETFEQFRRQIPVAWVEQALTATGTATLRRRRLPAEQVLWLVIGIGLYRNRSIESVVDSLDVALPSPTGAVAKSAIPPARQRLGDAPVQWLFERCAAQWSYASADRHRWRGLALYGIDGSSLRTADTEANRAEFGGWVAGKGDSSNPLVRLVVLMSLRSHLLAAARFGGYGVTSELKLAESMLEEIPPHSLTILDRLYLSASLLRAIESGGLERHWLLRAKTNARMRTVEVFAEGDEWVEMDTTQEAREQNPSLGRTWQARAIRYGCGSMATSRTHGIPGGCVA